MHQWEFQETCFIKDIGCKDRGYEPAQETYPGLLGRDRREKLGREFLSKGNAESESSNVRAPDYYEETQQKVSAEITSLVKGDQIGRAIGTAM